MSWFRLKPKFNWSNRLWKENQKDTAPQAYRSKYPGDPVTPEVARTLLFKRPSK